MAQIIHDNQATSVAHDGQTYKADENGVIDVPDHVAAHLVRFPGFRYFQAAAEAVAEDAIDEVAKLRARVAELEAAARKAVGRPGRKPADQPAAE